jgi:hypothetical protein
MHDMDGTPDAATSSDLPITDAERAEALSELSRRRAAGALTLGELADVARRVQAARTSRELEQALAVVAAGTSVAPAGRPRSLVFVLSGHRQQGRWRLGDRVRLVCILGGAELDLRQAIVDADEVTLTCVCVLGGAELIVPEGVPVSFSGLSILGGRSDERAPAAALPGAPTVHVRLFSLLGGIAVTGGRERAARRLELGQDALRVRLSGPLALAALRRELRIPYAAIREVSSEPAELPPAWALRVGTALPFSDVRHGLFRWGGRWRFYSLSDRRRAVTLRLDGFELGGRAIDAVVLGVDDPERWKRELEARRVTT